MSRVQAERFSVSAPGGRELEVIEAGPADGATVLVHHGTPGSAHEFWPPHLEQAIARGLRLVAYSRPGYAGSDRDPGRSVASCAADSAAIADALGLERLFTVGGSGGGPHALGCAALLPDRVIAAATIAGVGPTDADDLDWLAGMGDENVQEFGAARAGAEQLVAFLSEAASELSGIDGSRVAESLGDLVSDADAAALTGEYADFAADGIRDSLSAGTWGWFDDDLAFLEPWGFDPGSIAVPVTVWQGLDDRFVPAAHGEWLGANVAGARANLLEGEGHLSLALPRFGEILDQLLAAGEGTGR